MTLLYKKPLIDGVNTARRRGMMSICVIHFAVRPKDNRRKILFDMR